MRRGLGRRLRRRRASPALVLAVLLLAAVVGAAALPAAAAAHSALESSDPAADASVPVSPRQIVLTFSEAPDAELSLIRVLDAQGAAVPGMSAPQVVPGASAALQVTPSEPLADGVYTVNWRVVSSVDGHVESGAFAFGVGEQPAPDSAIVVELLHTSPWASALAGVGRWLLYAGLALLVGAATTSLIVYGGRLPGGGVTVLRAAAAVAVAGLVAMVWSQKVLIGAPSLLPLFVMRQGLLLLGLGVALALCIGAVVLVDLWPARWSLWLLGAAGAAAVLLHVLAGHAASPSSFQWLNLLAQWVHMTAIGVWVGGLFWLLLGFRGRDAAERGAAVGVFTRLATVVLGVVLLTGLTRAVAEVGSVSGLYDTRYGVTLLAKIALVVGLVGLGALNHFFWAPAVRAASGGAADRRFGLNSRGELGVALAVLAVTAALSGVAPARIAAAVPAASGGSSRPDLRLRQRLRHLRARGAHAHPGGRRSQRLRALGGRLRHRRPAQDRHRREPEVRAAGAPVGGAGDGGAGQGSRRQLDGRRPGLLRGRPLAGRRRHPGGGQGLGGPARAHRPRGVLSLRRRRRRWADDAAAGRPRPAPVSAGAAPGRFASTRRHGSSRKGGNMRRSATAVLTTALMVVLLGVLAAPVLAHETASAGAVNLELGWGTEPAYQGQLNTIQLIVTHKADGDPVNDPGARLTATVTYGDQRQEFALTPTYDPEATAPAPPGEYAALVIPTAPGDYTFHVTGKVAGAKVDLKVTSSPKTFSPVEDASAVQFPVKVPATDQVAERLDKELPRMAAAAEVADMESQVSSATTLGYVGIAVGAVGIVLAAVALLARRRA